MEGLPGVLGNKGTLAKYRREQGNMSLFSGNRETKLQIRGRKHFDIIYKERRLFLRFYLWSFMYNCHLFFLLYTRDHKKTNKVKALSWESGYEVKRITSWRESVVTDCQGGG